MRSSFRELQTGILAVETVVIVIVNLHFTLLSLTQLCVPPGFRNLNNFKLNGMTQPFLFDMFKQCLHVIVQASLCVLEWVTATKNKRIVLGSLLLAAR